MKQIFLYISLALTLFASCTENYASKQIKARGSPDSLLGKTTYVNPADGITNFTDGEFKEYTPDDGIPQVSGPVTPLNVVLLTEQKKIPDIIAVEKLAYFINDINQLTIKEFATVKESGQLILQFTIFSDKKAKIDLSHNGDFTINDSDYYVKLDLSQALTTCS